MKRSPYSEQNYFQVGGTLPSDAPSYIERQADEEIIKRIRKYQICLVLAPRQTGKSSLMVHAANALPEMFRCTNVDFQPLQEIRNLDSFFQYVVYELQRGLKLDIDTTSWWKDHSSIDPTQRFRTFLEDVLLGYFQEHLVIFFDEIESVLRFPFSDSFFVTIRAIFNARSTNPEFRRLNFVFIGVASPNSLIKEKSLTPFNIGYEIELGNFEKKRLYNFREVLGKNADSIIERIFYWTDGHPYLVQKLSEAAYNWSETERDAEHIDEEVKSKFLKVEIKVEFHLKFIQDYLIGAPLHKSSTLEALRIYREVLQGKKVSIDESCPHQKLLRLSGVIGTKSGILVKQNRIYETVFSLDWIKNLIQPKLKVKSAPYNPLVNTAVGLLILASTLRLVDSHPDPEHLYNQILMEIEEFENKARALGNTSEVIRHARYALLATLDEAVLQTSWGPNSVWSSKGALNVWINQDVSGGDGFFTILEHILSDSFRNIELIELMYFCLRLGFKGKYSYSGHSYLAKLSDQVFHTIIQVRNLKKDHLKSFKKLDK